MAHTRSRRGGRGCRGAREGDPNSRELEAVPVVQVEALVVQVEAPVVQEVAMDVAPMVAAPALVEPVQPNRLRNQVSQLNLFHALGHLEFELNLRCR